MRDDEAPLPAEDPASAARDLDVLSRRRLRPEDDGPTPPLGFSSSSIRMGVERREIRVRIESEKEDYAGGRLDPGTIKTSPGDGEKR